MIKAKHYDAAGKEKGEVTLPDVPFGAEPNPNAVWLAVKTYLANQRQGTAKTKSRSFVSGGGKKPYRQKGTGRARQGSTRAAQWVGGYTVFGPQPRDYSSKLPKKLRRTALFSVLGDRARTGDIAVVDDLKMETPSTKTVAGMLDAMGVGDRKVCVVTKGSDLGVHKSFRNLPKVRVLPHTSMNVYDLVNADVLVLTEGALGGITEVFGS
jgi:large subunit ribosomal protein L4